MFVTNETLLCLHTSDGRYAVVFTISDEDFNPSIGSTGKIQGHHFRVIRDAKVEPFQNGNTYWAVHALEISPAYH